ncbi:hypothetical protein [Desulforamulus aeronauticus]|uniref:Lipoprotein n=1 Tax=Desulforamulus aeronauticus DSM 10349 TaxID=1121421 RepID=A0A1M6WGI8_9FIRM|nr:hypothetical protein [Desulforamulus aeronauticus]SHK92635.1 hypothetical protein SAMN02745123_03613 [Desulforamulus aeronauticus DSM 10349]
MKKVSMMVMLSLVLLLVVGCTGHHEPLKTPSATTESPSKGSEEKTQQRPVVIVPTPLDNQSTPTPPRDVVKEAHERYIQQREADKKARQEWWDSVHRQQKEILEMKQQHEKDTRR